MQMKLTANQKIQISLRNKFLKKGVKMISPETIFFSKDTSIGKNVTIEPYVVILEKVSIKNNVRILDNCVYGMPSVDPKHKKFESERYWRGPVWSIMNYMISHGLEHEGEYSLAKRIKDDTIKLIEVSGMYEYFNPHTGKGLGGHDFSWTAAILLALGRDSTNLKFTNN